MKKVIPTEVYSRVVGYYRPVHQWNPGKQEEFNERKEAHVNKPKVSIHSFPVKPRIEVDLVFRPTIPFPKMLEAMATFDGESLRRIHN